VKHYRNPRTGKVHAYEDDAPAELHEGMTPLSEAEVWAHQNPPLSRHDQALAEIAALESQITPRRIRDALLGTGVDWLKNQETKIAAARGRL